MEFTDNPFGIVFDEAYFKSSMPNPPRISPDLRAQCEDLWSELMNYTVSDDDAKERHEFVLKTDNPAYERLKLERVRTYW